MEFRTGALKRPLFWSGGRWKGERIIRPRSRSGGQRGHLQTHSYPSVKSILARGLDRQNVIESVTLTPSVEHANIRGAGYYAGSLFEEVAE